MGKRTRTRLAEITDEQHAYVALHKYLKGKEINEVEEAIQMLFCSRYTYDKDTLGCKTICGLSCPGKTSAPNRPIVTVIECCAVCEFYEKFGVREGSCRKGHENEDALYHCDDFKLEPTLNPEAIL